MNLSRIQHLLVILEGVRDDETQLFYAGVAMSPRWNKIEEKSEIICDALGYAALDPAFRAAGFHCVLCDKHTGQQWIIESRQQYLDIVNEYWETRKPYDSLDVKLVYGDQNDLSVAEAFLDLDFHSVMYLFAYDYYYDVTPDFDSITVEMVIERIKTLIQLNGKIPSGISNNLGWTLDEF